MTNKEAIETLQAMRNNLDPRFMVWERERRKDEALRMAIDLLERGGENATICKQALERD